MGTKMRGREEARRKNKLWKAKWKALEEIKIRREG